MTEIEKVLNPDFLLQLVSIEKIKYLAVADTSIKNKGLDSRVELRIMLLEPTEKEHEVNEQLYELTLANVAAYKIDFTNVDNRTFEFDTDEVKLKRHDKTEDMYGLSFVNASVNLYIAFSKIEIRRLNGDRHFD